MKAVLVIDMPKRCFDCPLHEYIERGDDHMDFYVCVAENWRKPITHTPIYDFENRPEWCPLRLLPQNYDNSMNIVINIPKPHYERLAIIANNGHEPLGYFERVILHGIPLCDEADNAPTIVEVDKDKQNDRCN